MNPVEPQTTTSNLSLAETSRREESSSGVVIISPEPEEELVDVASRVPSFAARIGGDDDPRRAARVDRDGAGRRGRAARDPRGQGYGAVATAKEAMGRTRAYKWRDVVMEYEQ